MASSVDDVIQQIKAKDELITPLRQKIWEYEQEVTFLQTKVWDLLKHINPNKENIRLIEDNLYKERHLTKFGEIDYLLEAIYKNADASDAAYKEALNEVVAAKELLESECINLKKSIDSYRTLLGESDEEVEKLRESLLKEQTGSKKLAETAQKDRERLEKQALEIAHLKVETQNLRRELNTVHRAASPVVLKKDCGTFIDKDFLFPPVPSLDKLPQKSNCIAELQGYSAAGIRVHLSPVEESTSEKVQNNSEIIVLTSSTGNINSANNLEETNNSQSSFSESETNSLENHFNQQREDHSTLLHRKVNEFVVDINNLEQAENTKMANSSEISDVVGKLIPYFTGANTTELPSDVHKFIEGCELLKRDPKIKPEFMEVTITCIKHRLAGEAYSQFKERSFKDIDELAEAVKLEYLKRRSLETVRGDIYNCRQNIGETVRHFGGRMQTLLSESMKIVQAEWKDEQQRKSLLTDYKSLAVRCFIKGLSDQTWRYKLSRAKDSEIKDLVEQIEQDEEFFEDSFHTTINYSQTTKGQNFESKDERSYLKTQDERIKHERRNQRQDEIKCTFCKKVGHLAESCYTRLGRMFCKFCRVKGHETNRFCEETTRNVLTQNQSNTRPENPFAQNPFAQNPFAKNQQNQPWRVEAKSFTPRDRNNFVNCYNCGENGHIAARCPRRTNNHSGNSARPDRGQ